MKQIFKTASDLDRALALPAIEPGAFRFAKQFAPAGFVCADCEQTKPFPMDGCGTGYARCDDKPDGLVCYACCGIRDEKQMIETGKAVLYLSMERGAKVGTVSNWPGTLSAFATVKRGAHNIARYRYDAWFKFKGENWHGVQIGENTQIIRCKRVKG